MIWIGIALAVVVIVIVYRQGLNRGRDIERKNIQKAIDEGAQALAKKLYGQPDNDDTHFRVRKPKATWENPEA